jgi:hypothetical protein
MINNILFTFAWFAVPWLWIYVLKLGGMRLMTLSLPSFVLISIFIFQYAGFPVLYFGLDEYRAEYVTDRGLLLEAWLITSVSSLLLCLGALFGSLILNPLGYFKSYENINFFLPLHLKRKVYILGVFCIGVLLTYIAKVGFENIALITVFKGATSGEIALARSLMGNDFGSAYHWYNFFMRECLIFISLILIAIKINGAQYVSGIYTFSILFATVFSLIMATEKALFIDFLIAISLVYVISKRRGVVSSSLIINLFVYMTIVLISFYIFFMGDAGIAEGAWSVFSRGFTGSLQPIYHYLEFFPMKQDWQYGATFPNPGGIFPFTPYNLTVEVMNFVQPDHYNTGIVGTMPAIYWGEIFANFGYWGVLTIPLFVGFALYLINWCVYSLKLNPLNAALFAWLLVHYKNLSITSISMFVFDFNLILILAAFYIMRIRFRN